MAEGKSPDSFERSGIPGAVEIRRVREEDAAAYLAIGEYAVRETLSMATLGMTEEEARETVADAVVRNLPFFVAVVDGKVIGWGHALPYRMEPVKHMAPVHISILPGYQGARLGTTLLHQIVEAARAIGLQRIETDVVAAHASAVRLVEAYGFQHEGLRPRSIYLAGRYWDVACLGLLL